MCSLNGLSRAFAAQAAQYQDTPFKEIRQNVFNIRKQKGKIGDRTFRPSLDDLSPEDRERLLRLARLVKERNPLILPPRPARLVSSLSDATVLDYGSGREKKHQPENVKTYDPYHVSGEFGCLLKKNVPPTEGFDSVVAINSVVTCSARKAFEAYVEQIKEVPYLVVRPNVDLWCKEQLGVIVEDCPERDSLDHGRHYKVREFETADCRVQGIECDKRIGGSVLTIGHYDYSFYVPTARSAPRFIEGRHDFNRGLLCGINRMITHGRQPYRCTDGIVAVPKIDGELHFLVCRRLERGSTILLMDREEKVIRAYEMEVPFNYTLVLEKVTVDKDPPIYYLIGVNVAGIDIPVRESLFKYVHQQLRLGLFSKEYGNYSPGVPMEIQVRPFEFVSTVPSDGVVIYPTGNPAWGLYYKYRDNIDFDIRGNDYQALMDRVIGFFKVEKFPLTLGEGLHRVVCSYDKGIVTFIRSERRVDKSESDGLEKVVSVIVNSLDPRQCKPAVRTYGGESDSTQF